MFLIIGVSVEPYVSYVVFLGTFYFVELNEVLLNLYNDSQSRDIIYVSNIAFSSLIIYFAYWTH